MQKSGLKSTEFYSALVMPVVTAVITFLVTVNIVPESETDQITQRIAGAVVAAVGMYASIKPLMEYIRGRSEQKTAAIKSPFVPPPEPTPPVVVDPPVVPKVEPIETTELLRVLGTILTRLEALEKVRADKPQP